MLVVEHQEIVPIDHGYIFPHDLSQIHFIWVEWEQTAIPFTEHELSYIALLDPERDRHMLLEELYLEEIFANRLFVATVLLKCAAIRGLNPMEIGGFMIRKRGGRQEYSKFEQLIENIKHRNPSNWTLFSRCVYEEVEGTLDDYQKNEKIN